MTDIIEGQPDAQEPKPETPETIETPEVKEAILPDNTPDKVDVDSLKKQAEQEKSDLTERLKKSEDEKELLEKRNKDKDEYISRTRKVEKEVEQVKPQKTFEDYLGDLDKLVDTDFENDPKDGLKKVVRKLASDVAYDRDLERRDNEKRMSDSEERAFRKAISLDPERGKAIKEIEKLDDECPDMKELSYERKLEFISLRNATVKNNGNKARDQVARERDLSADAGGSRMASRGERMPAWLSDSEVMREGKAAGFTSKQEMLDWSNPDKAREMYEKARRQQS